jgi:hypothetical protein
MQVMAAMFDVACEKGRSDAHPCHQRQRGQRQRPDGRLYCVGEDHVVAFDFSAGSFAGPVVDLARLNGQALVLVP